MKHAIFILLFCFGLQMALATDRYVALPSNGGNDANPGTIGSPKATIQAAYNIANAGDTVYVGAGLYAESPRFDRPGTSGNLITINGQNVATFRGCSLEAAYNQVVFCMITNGATTFNPRVYVAQNAAFNIVRSNLFDMNTTLTGYPIVQWNGPASYPWGACGSSNTFTYNRFQNIRDEMVFRINGYQNVIGWNVLTNTDNTDQFQIAGGTNYIVGNVCLSMVQLGVYVNNHADLVQIFGNAGGTSQTSWSHYIYSNLFYAGNVNVNSELQIGNLTDDELSNVGGLHFWNNIFIGIPAKCSVAAPEVEWLNNLFVNCATNSGNGGAALIFSNLPGVGHGDRGTLINNIFVGCGVGSSTINGNGWYYFEDTLTNVSADYNVVTKKIAGTWTAVDQDPNTAHIITPGGTWNKFLWYEPHGKNGVDPGFVNEAQLDYRLQVNSILRNAGLPLAAFTNDFRGATRDTQWEPGPYEFQASDFNTYPGDVGPRLIQAQSVVASGATTINIPYNLDRQEIKIGRRMATNKVSAWTVFTNLYTLNSAAVTNTISFTDSNIANRTYEYEIQQLIRTNALTGGDVNGYRDFQYLWAGYHVPLQDARGNVCLLVESGVAASLVSELARLKLDLQGAGYKVYRHDVAADEVGSGTWKTNVVGIKSLIQTDYNSDSGNPWFVFIVGHVPVPYSGIGLTPGSHTDNVGAHGTDLYYADLDGTFTDTGNTSATDASVAATSTHNAAGDGKFDQDTIPSAPEVRIGRVDLGHSNFPAFANTEVQRLKQYLDRNHNWRHKVFTVRNKAVIYYGPNPGLTVDAKPLEGHDLMAGFFGNTTSVDLGNWLPMANTTANSYLFALEDGSGGVDHSIQLGSSDDFAASPLYAVFTSAYGSYFGSWDSMNTNAFLKSIPSNAGYPLTTSYRENYMQVGSSAMDEPIGYEEFAEASQFSVVGTGKEYTWYVRVIGGSGVTSTVNFATKMYESLFGDPTLTTHQVAPVANLAANGSGADNVVTWTASVDASDGYHVYRAPTSDLNSFTRLTTNPTTSTSYTDTGASGGTWTYMVRAVKEDGLPNRSFYDASQGMFAAASGGGGGGGGNYNGRVSVRRGKKAK